MAKNINLRKFMTTSRYLQIAISSEKQVSFKLKVVFSTNLRPKTKKIVRAVFEKNIKVSDFGLIQRTFREYFQIKKFFKKSDFVNFLPLQSHNFTQKIRKILRVVSEKTALPTNQPINQPTNQPTKQPPNQTTNQPTNQPTSYCQQHRFYGTWLTPFTKGLVLPVCK